MAQELPRPALCPYTNFMPQFHLPNKSPVSSRALNCWKWRAVCSLPVVTQLQMPSALLCGTFISSIRRTRPFIRPCSQRLRAGGSPPSPVCSCRSPRTACPISACSRAAGTATQGKSCWCSTGLPGCPGHPVGPPHQRGQFLLYNLTQRTSTCCPEAVYG